MLGRLVIVGSIAAAWAGSFCGALALAKVEMGHWAGMCGPWGCLPESGPLISVHGMWLSLIGGATWLSRLAIPIFRTWQPWMGILLATALFTVIMLGMEFSSYLGLGGDWQHLVPFTVYKLAIWTDWPLLQIILCSAVNLCLSRGQSAMGTRETTNPMAVGSSS